MRGAPKDAGGIAKAPSQPCLWGEGEGRAGALGWPGRVGGCRAHGQNWAVRGGHWSGGVHHGLGPQRTELRSHGPFVPGFPALWLPRIQAVEEHTLPKERPSSQQFPAWPLSCIKALKACGADAVAAGGPPSGGLGHGQCQGWQFYSGSELGLWPRLPGEKPALPLC